MKLIRDAAYLTLLIDKIFLIFRIVMQS